MDRPTGSPSPDPRPPHRDPTGAPSPQQGQDSGSPVHRSAYSRKPPEPSPWLLLSAGIELGGAIILLTLAGWWLDGKLGTEPILLIVGLCLGFLAGFTQLLRQVRRFQQADDAAKSRERKPRPPNRPKS